MSPYGRFRTTAARGTPKFTSESSKSTQIAKAIGPLAGGIMRRASRLQRLALAAVGLLLLANLAIAVADEQKQSSESADIQTSQVALSVEPQDVGSDQSASKPVLVFIRLRPSKTRSKAEVVTLAKKWLPKSWGAAGNADLSVIDNDAVVLTSKDMDEALKAKDWLLTQQVVYEVELNQGGDVHRRPGDVSLEELRRGLSRNAQQERRKQGWAWLKRAAKQQGIKLKRPRRKRSQQGRLAGEKIEL